TLVGHDLWAAHTAPDASLSRLPRHASPPLRAPTAFSLADTKRNHGVRQGAVLASEPSLVLCGFRAAPAIRGCGPMQAAPSTMEAMARRIGVALGSHGLIRAATARALTGVQPEVSQSRSGLLVGRRGRS